MMKLSIDSNLSLSLNTRTVVTPITLYAITIESIKSENFTDCLASFVDLNSLTDKDKKSQLTFEQGLIKSKINQAPVAINILQTIQSAVPKFCWYAMKDQNNRLYTVLSNDSMNEKQMLKFCEKIKSAVVHFKSNPDKLQKKIESMAGMFNESFVSEIPSTFMKNGQQEMSELSTARDFSVRSVDQGNNKILEPIEMTDVVSVVKEETTEKEIKLQMNWKNILYIVFGLFILWIFVHKFFKIRPKRH